MMFKIAQKLSRSILELHTTLDFGLQSGWGNVKWELLLASAKCHQFVSEWWRKVILCSESAINVC